MAGSTLNVKLTRGNNQPWGFRLAGGKDFNSPLSLQKVNTGSLAEQAGLLQGDYILKINDLATENMRHKEAQDALVRAGNHFEIVVQRGGMKTWKPTVTKLTTDSRVASNDIQPVTKTSLAHTPQEARNVGSGYNVKPKPFGEQNGDQRIPSMVHKQYNSPAPLYSMQNIADTLTAQAEVLSTGAVGYNFMKNPTPVNKDSAVYRMVLEEKSAPPPEKQEQVVEETFGATQDIQSRSFKVLQKSLDDGDEPHQHAVSLRHVEPPKPVAPKEPSADGSKPGDNLCGECGRLIIGVFVRIKEKNLHADCFKCTTCGSSLRNVGYYNINDKLYCDVHARQVAKNAAPSTPTISSSGKEVHIVGVASQGAPASSFSPSAGSYSPSAGNFGPSASSFGPSASSFGPPASSFGPPASSFSPSAGSFSPSAGTFSPSSNFTPFQAKSVTAPISVDTSTVRHIQSSTSDVHKQFTGGSKFTWPPQKLSETTAAPTAAETVAIDTSLSPTIPSYRAPPSTQHVQFTSAKFKQTHTTTTHSSSSFNPAATASPKSSPSFSPLIPAKTTVPSIPSAVATAKPSSPTPFNSNLGHVAGHKPFSPLTVSAKPVVAPHGPVSPLGSSSVWVPTSPIGATTKPIPTAPTAGSRPAPRRGRGILNPSAAPGARIPVCSGCGTPIRGPFVTALGKTWCHNHFHCVNAQCRRPLQDIGFVEEQGQLYCELCYETYLAPVCSKCNARIKGDCLNAIGKQWHPDCFVCGYCRTAFGNNHFYLEDGLPYCEKDWNELFTTKCVGCGFPIEAGDRWVEALNSNYHSQCFKCTICHKNLEGQSFYAKGGRPFCKNHAR